MCSTLCWRARGRLFLLHRFTLGNRRNVRNHGPGKMARTFHEICMKHSRTICGPNSLHIHAVLALPWFEHFRCPPVLAYRFRRSSSACFTRLGMASSLDLGAPSNSSPKIASFVVAVHGGRIVQYAYTQKTNGQAIQAQRFTTRLVPSPCRQSARPKAPT